MCVCVVTGADREATRSDAADATAAAARRAGAKPAQKQGAVCHAAATSARSLRACACTASHYVVVVVCCKVCLRKIMHVRIVVAKHYFG